MTTQHSYYLILILYNILYSKYRKWRSNQDGEPEINREYRFFKRRSLQKSKHQHRKNPPPNYVTNHRKTRDIGGEVMVETTYTVHQKDSEYRSQRNENRPRNTKKLQGRSGTPDLRFVDLGTGRVSDNEDDKNR